MAGVAGTTESSVTDARPAPARAPRRLLAEFAINPRHVGVLLWLRWKLSLRGFGRGGRGAVAMRAISLFFTVLFAVVVGGGAGVLTTLGYLYLSRPLATQLLFGALGLLYIIWALLPLLQYSVNEGLDVTKLTIYPLTRGEQMVSLTLATLFDPSVFVILAIDVAVVIGWHATARAALITVVALIFTYAHIVGLSQLALAGMMGLLRSRRYRDLTIIVFAVVGASCSLLQFAVGSIFSQLNFNTIPTLHLDTYLQWSPPGMAARAISLADQGAYLPALLWLVVLAALTPVLFALWAFVLDRGVTTAESAGGGGGGASRRRRVRAESVAGGAVVGVAGAATTPGAARAIPIAVAARGWRPISRPALAITTKDLRYFWRDPQIKASLLSSLVLMALVLVSNFAQHNNGNPATGQVFNLPGVLLAPLPSLVIVLSLAINAFGLERQGLQTLFLFPIRPLDVFWGKNLAVGGVAFIAQVVLTLVVAGFSGEWLYAPVALVAGLSAILVMLGCGNVSSIIAPFRVRQMRMGENNLSSENGCLRSIISMVVLFSTVLLLIPVALAVIIPLALSQPLWLTFTLPLTLVYGITIHQLATRLIAPRLLSHAPELLALTTREA